MSRPDFTRANQKAGDFTTLEISEKEFHDTSVALLKKQLELVEEQKKYGKTIKWATIVTGVATAVMALVMIFQYMFPIRESVSVSQAPTLQVSPQQK
jgi:hypothetical protein